MKAINVQNKSKKFQLEVQPIHRVQKKIHNNFNRSKDLNSAVLSDSSPKRAQKQKSQSPHKQYAIHDS